MFKCNHCMRFYMLANRQTVNSVDICSGCYVSYIDKITMLKHDIMVKKTSIVKREIYHDLFKPIRKFSYLDIINLTVAVLPAKYVSNIILDDIYSKETIISFIKLIFCHIISGEIEIVKYSFSMSNKSLATQYCYLNNIFHSFTKRTLEYIASHIGITISNDITKKQIVDIIL